MPNNKQALARLPVVNNWNADYVEDLYDIWQQNPDQLTESWRMFFQGFELAQCPRSCVAATRARAQSQVASLIYAFRSQGHLIAQTDPLGENLTEHPDLDPARFGFTDSDFQEVFDTGHLGGPDRARLSEIIKILKDTYCRSIGVQYTHIQETAVRRWLQAELEPNRNQPSIDRAKKHDILSHLNDAEMFETFIQTKYPGHKRFSLQGAETLIPAIHALVELAPEEGVSEIVIGMAHRGRLNMLTNILDKSYETIFTEFEGYIPQDSFGGDGDVKYHVGFSSDHENSHGHSVHLSLVANPSHLEAVDPVVLGKARAKQRQLHYLQGGSTDPNAEIDRRGVVPLLIHGDAAFSGQGIVSETLNMSQLKGYQTGGTIHFVINNQIGFTTNPEDSRSSAYCTDVAKIIEAPIFHVNGDDPEAVVYVIELALRFRQKFGRDVVIDMVCYRRHGHNEADEPAFTQPLMYRKIKDRRSVTKIYTQQLLEQNEISKSEVKTLASSYKAKLQEQYERHKSAFYQVSRPDGDVRWKGLFEPYTHETGQTGVTLEILQAVTRALTTIPEGFNLNPKIARQLPPRAQVLASQGSVDWSFGESLAFGTLLLEGVPVRLSGQDSERGTFSQRHAGWRDLETGDRYVPLNQISPDQVRFCVYNSPLSEASVLGFDYGYSLAEPRMLILWEAQFGDFSNGAQMIIDQFIISSQSKWQRTSGLVMLLPHGYEGQGAEHSNAYLERYLAACGQNNIQVCNLTTPAQYFHVLRRQMKRPFRRPLIIMSPKSMLRHKLAVSPVNEFISGKFQEILDDPEPPPEPRRLILCSGKLFYELQAKREQNPNPDAAIIRIEQLYPIRNDLMREIAARYQNVEEIIWAQEEPKNRGAWSFIRPWLQYLFPDIKIRYVGRGYAASPASGSLVRHNEDQARIIETAIHGESVPYDVTILPEGAEKL